MEIVSAIVYQLTKNMKMDQIKESGYDTYFVDHTASVYPQAASGVPFSTESLAVSGDIIADLTEDLAAEQKARLSYDNILRLVDDNDVRDPIKYLRAREIVHFQRFGEPKLTRRKTKNRKSVADKHDKTATFHFVLKSSGFVYLQRITYFYVHGVVCK